MSKIVGFVICWGLLIAPCAVAQTRVLSPTYWKQRLFYIPYQVKGSEKLLDPVAKVQLLISRTGANDWQTLEEAEPNVQGFSFHAPEDGEYWFALRHLDRRGQPWPSPAVQPQMRIIVDTVKPTLTLEGSLDATGEIIVRYEARDANLNAASLAIEVHQPGSPWSPLKIDAPDVAQPNRLLGRSRWRPPTDAEDIGIRASIADHAGQREQTETKISGFGTPHSVPGTQYPESGPSLGSPLAEVSNFPQSHGSAGAQLPKAFSNSSASTARLSSQDWPASNRLPVIAPSTKHPTPPPSNPYTTVGQAGQNRTPAKLVGDGAQTLRMTPLGPDNAPALAESTLWPVPLPRENVAQNLARSDWGPAQTPADPEGWGEGRVGGRAGGRVVNSRTFDIEYDLQSVGPWGVSKIELWGTRDNGRTWRSFGVDPDNRSPFRVTVPEAGTFGFRILVDGANTAGTPPPQSGDQPELSVSVDLQPPTAELLAADLGQGNLADHLMVRWTASDTNLEPRPIALFYSSYPNGPWSTIASGLENTGKYTWRIERHVPGRFYLRLEARDTAGNQASYQTSTPIKLARPQPTGRLRNVRPISE